MWKFTGRNAHGHIRRAFFLWKSKRKKEQAEVTEGILRLWGTTFWMEVEAHVTRAILYGNLQEKCRTPIPGTAFFVEIYKKKAHGHVTRPIVSGNLHEKCRRLVSGPPLCLEIYKKKCAILCGNLQEIYRTRRSPP